MADDAPPKLDLADLRAIVIDGDELAKGTRIVDDGGLAHLARAGKKLFADAAGSQVYKVQLAFADGRAVKARCSCMAARSRPFCKHASALLVAWARMADAFAVADAPPPGLDDGKKRKVKAGSVSAADLMGQGVAQVATLVRELAVAGVATMADDRAPQVRALGENLREHRLRRLSAKTIALADLLTGARGQAFDEAAYAELMADLLLTSRKLEKHLAGEPLDPRHVEELIGKTWTKKDRAPVTGLELLEVGFVARETADDYLIRESRFIDLAGGGHYSEKQILPRAIAKRTTPKLSHAGHVLAAAAGSQYPGYSPLRLDLEPGERVAVTGAHLERLRAVALPDVKAAIAALQEHRRDVFAPDVLPVIARCDAMIADRGRLQLVDAAGAAVFLADDELLGDRLATALAGVGLVAAIGDLALDGALPTLAPMAVLVLTRHGGLELRGIAAPGMVGGRRRLTSVASEGRIHWAETARAVGMSTAAIALGEVREEMAGLLYAGLVSVTPRRVEPLAACLRELGLGKQADAMVALAARPDPAERLDDLIKLHQVLGVALARLAGAAAVDRAELEASPMYASVFVRRPDEVLAPRAIADQVARGRLGRFEAAARYAAYYRTIPPAELLEQPYPTWADGSASPFVALAAGRDPARARATAEQLLELTRDAPPSKGRRLAPPRMALITALRVLEALGDDLAVAALRAVGERHPDVVIRALATAAVWRATHGGTDPPGSAWRAKILSAPLREERLLAIQRAVEHGDVGAIPVLRLALAGDGHLDIREAAGKALGRLGDADSVDGFIAALERRAADPGPAMIAARALGQLGDVRGIHALLDAYQTSWRPEIITEAITALGPAVIPELLALVEERPALLKRGTARAVFDTLAAGPLTDAIIARLEAADPTTIVARAVPLLDLVKPRADVARAVADRLLALFPTLADKQSSKEARALARKAAALLEPA